MKHPAAFILTALLLCACSGKDEPPRTASAPMTVSTATPQAYPEISVPAGNTAEPAVCDTKKPFAGSKGETAAEYLLGMRLSTEDTARWAKDKRTCRYHTYLAEKLTEAQAASQARKKAQEQFFAKLGTGIVDLEKLSATQETCARETALYTALSAKLAKGAPPVYFRSNETLHSAVQAAAQAAKTRDEKLTQLLAGWRKKTTGGDNAAFPAEAAKSIMDKQLPSPRENGGWDKIFREDCERYFDRSIAQRG